MIILDVDKQLFRIIDALPQELTNQIQSLNWMDMPFYKGAMQETWLRRHIDSTQHPILVQAEQLLSAIQQELENHCDIKFSDIPYTTWWIDEPGFSCSLHTDGELPSSMQLFWIAPNHTYGTKFYKSKNLTDLKYDFMFEANTGYIMLNQAKSDYQLLQWHAMPNVVPANTYRLTSYTYFGNYR